MSVVSDRIRQRREELNMSQEELAAKLKYKSRSTIAKIESGKGDLPQSKLKAFANALEVTPGWLLGDNNAPKEYENIQLFAGVGGLSYYHDPETAQLADQLKNQPGMRMLFDAAKDVSPEDLETVVALMKRFKKTSQ